MARSTAKFISYDLRPAKQSERGILVDILRVGGDCGLPVRDYRYVGMGANRFYDFLMLHKYVGLRKMVSLEHDPNMFKRAQFNVPYKFIGVLETTAADFLATDAKEDPTVYWLDYDGGIGPHIVADILSMSLRTKLGDFAFVTVFGGPPRSMDRLNDQDRLTTLKDTLPDHTGLVELEDVERSAFPLAVHKILLSAFKEAYAPRTDGRFRLLLQVEYADSLPMVTVGGAFLSDGLAASYLSRMKSSLPFLKPGKDQLYEIRSLNLTERERALFDRAVTSGKKRSAERNTLKSLGFKEPEIKAYEELIRYLPRYFEAII